MPESIYMLPIIGVIGQDFKYTDVLMHLNAARESTYIKLIIDSPGGYTSEGEKIRQALIDSKKVMFSTNSGDVASYAVSLFSIAPRANRVFNPDKGQFLIHMPFVTPEDGVSGTADELESIAKELKKLQNNIVADYSKATGTDVSVLEGFMNENVPLTPQQVETLGFARLEQHELKAVAIYKNNLDMTNEESVKKLGVLETLLNKVVALIMPKSLMLQDVNGKELDFGADIQTPEQIAVGVKATVAGAPANGDYALASGEVYKFVSGELMEIVPAGGAPNAELEALKAENDALKQQIAAKDTEFGNFKLTAEKQIKEVKEEFTKFKNEFSTGDPAPNTLTGDPGKPTTRKAFK